MPSPMLIRSMMPVAIDAASMPPFFFAFSSAATLRLFSHAARDAALRLMAFSFFFMPPMLFRLHFLSHYACFSTPYAAACA